LGYVDLQQRWREERAREKRGRGSLREEVGTNPYALIGGGFVLGVLASWIAVSSLDGYTRLVTLLILLAGLGVWRPRGDEPKSVEPRFGGEKQLLAAIQSAGGTMTPVKAALETSLTVDEAEKILTRLADRGHLFVESRDGVLYYVLPGRRH
jgi:hypothetical protein